jgi:hypothetical protein
MQGSTVALIGVGVVGAGGLAWWLLRKRAAAQAAAAPPMPTVAQPSTQTKINTAVAGGLVTALSTQVPIPSFLKTPVTNVAQAVVNVPTTIVSSIGSALGFGSSKVCRASNNKDVFPNDMQMCAQYGRTDCNSCGLLYNLNTRKWPWQ